MPMTSDHWDTLVDPRIREAYFIGYGQEDRRQSMIDQLFSVRRTDIVNEKVQQIGGVSAAKWTLFEDAGRTPYVEPVKHYEETFTPHEFTLGIKVERKLIDDNRVPEALALARALGDSSWRMREKAAANVFINAFSAATSETLDDFGTDATGADAVALCSAAHPTNPLDSTALTNEGTLALSKANVSSTRQLHMALTDLNGDLLNIMPDELLVPPELEDTALEIVRSTLDPVSANNAINPQAGRFTVKVWHQLTDATAWFMMDSSLRRENLRFYERIPMELQGPIKDEDTQISKWVSYQRFTLGWVDWRFIYGQNG
ncbi:MAG: Mu-like prophage major head subunit gpT family protein [Gemmatimonadaceae bacterium]|nr:Mu-like prophage major head subunit gpT family protein [Gemmatimonadaceae bacterium]